MRFLCLGAAVAVAALAFACTSETSSGDGASESALAESDAADAGAVAPVPLAAIDPEALVLDGRSRAVDYNPLAAFTAFSFKASAGAHLSLIVDSRTRGGRPQIWLANAGFVTLETSNTSSGTAYVSHVVTAEEAGTFYLVLRDAKLKPGRFLISGTGGDVPAPPPVDVDAGAPTQD